MAKTKHDDTFIEIRRSHYAELVIRANGLDTTEPICDECGIYTPSKDSKVIRLGNTDSQVKIKFEYREMSGSGGCMGISISHFCDACSRKALLMLANQIWEDYGE